MRTDVSTSESQMVKSVVRFSPVSLILSLLSLDDGIDSVLGKRYFTYRCVLSRPPKCNIIYYVHN